MANQHADNDTIPPLWVQLFWILIALNKAHVVMAELFEKACSAFISSSFYGTVLTKDLSIREKQKPSLRDIFGPWQCPAKFLCPAGPVWQQTCCKSEG